jgi:hypothetical protein
MKMSLRDIGEIVNRAKEEKERQEHKPLSVQAYDKFSKGKTPLQVAIDSWYFVQLCKAAKAAKIGVSQVINLLGTANNYLPLV